MVRLCLDSSYKVTMDTLNSRIPLLINILANNPSDPPIVRDALMLKASHTDCVAANCLYLAEASGCSERQVQLAERIGLCHDLGRFPQFARFRTFNDSKSVDHGLLSLKLISALHLDTDLSPRERGILWASVMLHNRPRLPEGLPEDTRFFAALIRDADRLDIFRIFRDYYLRGPVEGSPLELGFPDDGTVTPAIADAILSGISPRYELGNSVQDMRLIKLSWIYSLKTPGALARFHDCGILEASRAVLPDTAVVNRVLDTIAEYKTGCLK